MASEIGDQKARTSPGVPKMPADVSKVASVVSGSVSGAIISAIVQPFDVVRTRMQGDAMLGTYRSTISTLRLVVDENGIRGLWRGTTPTVLRLALGAGTHFFFLEQLKPLFATRQADGTQTLSAAGAAATGGISRAISACALVPVTVIKTKMEATGALQQGRGSGVLSVARSIVRQQGVVGLWRGWLPTVLTNAPFSAIYYATYLELRKRFSHPAVPQVVVNLSAGMMAAMAATLATQPSDVIRARMQLDGTAKGATAMAVDAFNKDGIKAMLSGATPRFLKRSLQTALVWTLYEELVPLVTKATSARRSAP